MLTLLLTIAAMLSLAADRAQASLWCHCDGDLCTAGNRTQVCPDKMPEQIRHALLGAFSGHAQQGVSAQILREMLVERGFDQLAIADIFAEMTTLDIDTYIRYAELNTSDFRAFLMRSPSSEIEAFLRGAMTYMRDLVDNRHNLTITALEYATLRRRVAALLAAHAWHYPAHRDAVLAGVDRRNAWALVSPVAVAALHADVDAVVPAMVEAARGAMERLQARFVAEMTVKPRADAYVKKRLPGIGDVLRMEYGIPPPVVAAVLDGVTGHTVDAFERAPLLQDFNNFLMFAGPDDKREILIEDYLTEKCYIVATQFEPRVMDDAEFAEAQELAREALLQEGMDKVDVDIMVAKMTRENIRFFESAYDPIVKALTKQVGSTNDTKIIALRMAQVATVNNSRETDRQFIAMIHPEVMQAAAKARDLPEPKRRVSVHYWSDQFCMKAVLPDEEDKTYRFCGHFATQAVGFQFRTGCHYEQILGMAPARFCRCATHLCNGARNMSSGWLWGLTTATMILSYIHI